MAKKKEVHEEENVNDYPPTSAWVDDWKLLKEVVKTNKEWRGNGNNKRFVTVFYGELK